MHKWCTWVVNLFVVQSFKLALMLHPGTPTRMNLNRFAGGRVLPSSEMEPPVPSVPVSSVSSQVTFHYKGWPFKTKKQKQRKTPDSRENCGTSSWIFLSSCILYVFNVISCRNRQQQMSAATSKNSFFLLLLLHCSPIVFLTDIARTVSPFLLGQSV